MFYLLTNMILSAPVLNRQVSGMQKFTAVFVVGSLLHLFWWAFLTSGRFSDVISSQFVLETYKKWFLWLLGIDIISILAMQRAAASTSTNKADALGPKSQDDLKNKETKPSAEEISSIDNEQESKKQDVYVDKLPVTHASRKELLEADHQDD